MHRTLIALLAIAASASAMEESDTSISAGGARLSAKELERHDDELRRVPQHVQAALVGEAGEGRIDDVDRFITEDGDMLFVVGIEQRGQDRTLIVNDRGQTIATKVMPSRANEMQEVDRRAKDKTTGRQ